MPGSSMIGGPAEDGSGSRHAGSPGADLFVDALQGALALVHADGGEIAMLDPARQLLVTRARMTHPRFDGAHGSPARTPAPAHAHPGGGGVTPVHTGARQGQGREQGPPSRTPPTDGASEFETQPTIVLPAGAAQRSYRVGDGLIGLVAQRREPVLVGRDEYRALARGGAGAEQDAPWHVAVPIFRPGALASPHADTALLGVIAVYNRDPHWSFTQREVELLALHADRLARSLALEDLRWHMQREVELLELLRGAGAMHELFARVRDVARRLVDAPSFALVRPLPSGTEVAFEVAERDGRVHAPFRAPLRTLPAWWGAVSRGKLVSVSSADERAAHPQYCVAGWGGDQPVQSLVAAPLVRGTSLLGAIVAASPRSDAYGPEQTLLFDALARATVTALDEAQRSSAQTRSEPLAELINAVLSLNVSLDLHQTVQTLAKLAAQVTAAQAAAVFLLDEHSRHLVAQARSRRSPASVVEELPAGEVHLPIAWRDLETVMKSGQFLLLDRLDDEWDERTAVGQFLLGEQIASAAVVPILHHAGPGGGQSSRALGVLLVYTPGQRQPFPGQGMSQEVAKLQSLASQAATAISNAMLYHDLHEALERQQEVDRLKDEFILTISHEFRTPLTTIDGYVSLLDRFRDKVDVTKIAQFTEEIRLASQQLAGMIQMLADAAGLSDQSLKVAMEAVSLHTAAKRALSTQPAEAKARVTVRIPEQLIVHADAERLPLIFSNLVGNALKYAPDGPIEVTARIESREALARQGRKHAAEPTAAPKWAVISVRDRGPGIAAEDLDKLFLKFVRLQKSLTTNVRGTGLGLWICREYVEAMGGDIWVLSEINQGADFQFCLPLDVTAGGKSGR